MPSSPKETAERIAQVTGAWDNIAADKSFAGMTLAKFKLKVQPSQDCRANIERLQTELQVEQDKRDLADAVSAEAIQQVVKAVAGDVEFGDDSPFYEALGYVRKSARKSGLKRPRKITKIAA